MMSEEQWTEVDQYFSGRLLPTDPSLESALETSVTAGLPAISVSPNQGKFLQILAQLVEASSILGRERNRAPNGRHQGL